MKKAFVLGKFLPFHKGHEELIRFALGNCDHLLVLVCCSDKETVPGDVRVNWISSTFRLEVIQERMTVVPYYFSEEDLAATSEASNEVTGKWAFALKEFLPEQIDTIISSEGYGRLLAQFMGLQYINFDFQRHFTPISATMIRGDIFKYWNYLPEAVRPYFAIKVCIQGTESTGKTTLAKKLAEDFNGTFVPEAGRRLIPTSKSFTKYDLLKVATEHAQDIDFAIRKGSSPLIILDTDVTITKSYAKFHLDTELDLSPPVYKINHSDLYIYLTRDIPFIQDGTRYDEERRNELDRCHLETILRDGIIPEFLTGSYQKRYEDAYFFVSNLLKNKKEEFCLRIGS